MAKQIDLKATLANMTDDELKAVLTDEGVLARMRALRKATAPDGVLKATREMGKCARCNKTIKAGWKYVEVDGLLLNHECAKKYAQEVVEGAYPAGDSDALKKWWAQQCRNIQNNAAWRAW